MTQLLLTIFLVILSACSSKPVDKEAALLHMQIGTGFLNKGMYPKALEELELAHKLDPSNPTIVNNLGVAYFAREKYNESETLFRRALKMSPKYTDARNNLARVLIEEKRYEESLQELKMVEKDLTYQDLDKMWFNIGLAHYNQKGYLSAKDAFLNALKVNRSHCLANNFYGQTLFHLRQYKLASEALDKAIEFCEAYNKAEPFFYSGQTYLHLGRKQKALARFEEVVRQDPHGRYAIEAKNIINQIKESL